MGAARDAMGTLSASPTISVVVPVWNVADHVGACLGSLAAQGFGDFEALVIDDGATDATPKRVRAAVAGDGRFRVIVQRNRGLGAARNAGLAAARGAFVAFLDGDDRVAPDWLGAMHAALADSGADWVACALRYVDPDGTGPVHPAIHGPPPGGRGVGPAGAPVRFALSDWGAVARHFPSAWNKLYRRALIGPVRFDEGTLYEDHAFFWRLAARTDHLLWLPRALYLQTQGRAGQITRDGGEGVFDQIRVLDQVAAIVGQAQGRPGGPAALARLATRLSWERARVIAQDDRRARFAAACRAWLARHALAPDPGPEPIPADWLAALGGGPPTHGDRRAPAPLDGAGRIVHDALMPPAPAATPDAPCSIAPDAPTIETEIQTEMLSFCPRDGASLAFDVNFRTHPYANLSFFDAGRQDILYHLSLRHAEWLAVSNRRLGGIWGAEHQIPVMLEATGDRVELRFTPPHGLEILINGETLCTHEGVFDRLEAIEAVDVQGGVVLPGLAMTGPHNLPTGGMGALRLEAGLRLSGWAWDPAGGARQRLGLRVERDGAACDDTGGGPDMALPGQAQPELAARLGAATDRLGLGVVVPGRLWRAVPGATLAADDPVLRLRATSNGLPCGTALTIRRSDLRAWIEALTSDARACVTALLTAIEHVRFTALWPELSAGAQAVLARIAAEQGVTAFLQAPASGPLGPDAARPEADGAARPPGAASPHDETGGIRQRTTAQITPQPVDQPPAPILVGPDARPTRPPAPPAADRMTRRLEQLRGAIAERLRTDPDADPVALLAEALHQPLPAVLRQRLCLALTETACVRDVFPALHALVAADRQAVPGIVHEVCAAAVAMDQAVGKAPGKTPGKGVTAGAPGPADRKPDAWAISLALPYVHMRGDAEMTARLMRDLSTTAQGWICTGAPAWVIRDVVGPRGGTLGRAARDDLIGSFVALLDREAAGYDGRAPCEELIRAMVALLRAGPRLSEALRADLEAAALRIYGLSRSFWAALDRDGAADPEGAGSTRLRAGRAAFASITAAVTDAVTETPAGGPATRRAARQAAADTALRFFAAVGCREAVRVRLELFGPGGLPPQPGAGRRSSKAAQAEDLPDLAALVAAGFDPDEALLRRFAAPGAPDVPAPLQPVLRAAVAERMTAGRQPMGALVARASRAAADLLMRQAAGQVAGRGAEARLDRILADLAAASDASAAFAGLGLGLRLCQALLRLGALPEAAQLCQALDTMVRALPEAEAGALASAAAVRSGLWGLRWLEADAATDPAAADLAGQALTLFAPALTALEELALPRQDAAAALAGDPRAALFDTLVVVMSCRPYLDSRIPTLRAGWLARLEALGVPWVVAVGGTEGPARLDGRVLHLEAPDDYEGLPLKTLALMDWVREQTRFAHVLKIDDDCLVDPEALFHAHSHTTAAWHGRIIRRDRGSLDRLWHIPRSTTDRGRMEIDKSPERSVYCDGGSGYALDRAALEGLRRALDTPEGQALVSVSLMEDKLVGDLLAQVGIAPGDSDHRVTVHRRSRPGGEPVPRWSQGFLPGPASGVRVAHLDSTEAQAPALASLEGARLVPSKIWSPAAPVSLGHNSGALTLISPPARLARAAAAPVAVVACVRNEAAHLPAFLEHYRRMGVEGFLVVDNLSDDGTLEMLRDAPDVAVFSTDTDYDAGLYGVVWQHALLTHYRVGRWTLVADADELLVADPARTTRLPELLDGPDFADAEAVRLFLLDMYPAGSLATAEMRGHDPFDIADHVDRTPFLQSSLARGPHSDAPTWTSALRHRLFPGARPELFVAQKIALLRYRPWMRLSAGLHYVADARLARRALCLAHFKYHAGFHARARAEVARGRHFNGAEEYAKYLALMETGRPGLFDAAVSVPWRDSPFVRTLLGMAPG